MSDWYRCFICSPVLRAGTLCAAIFLLSSCAQKPTIVDDESIVAQGAEKSYDEYETTVDTRLAMARDLTMFPESSRDELVELPPPETDLWEVIVNGYAMSDLEGPLVEKWERWYAARPDYVERMVERSRLFLYHITHEVEARGMPMEIVLLPMIESAYNPNALSRSSAAGIWQFIPSTGKHYGLKQDWWMDERRDVLSATDSALNYLQKLYGDFNDWHLALAAYNWGEGSVSRAQAKNRANKKPETYTALKMPDETRNYVPKLQAVKNIIRDPDKYGLTLIDIPDAPYFTVVKMSRKMDVDMAASLAEMSKEEFLALNPQHNRPVIAGGNESTLLLPIDKANIFATKLDLVDQPLVTWQAYKMHKGETFAHVADKFNMTLEALRAVNGLGSRAQAREGVMLMVPAEQPSAMTEASLANAVFTTVPSTRTTYYKVKKGDTLSGIAKRYNVSVNELMRLNGIKKASSLRAGKSIRVMRDAPVYASAANTGKSASGKTTVTSYTVQKGDTLSSIAKRHGVSVQSLKDLNNISNPSSLRAGTKIRIHEKAATQVAARSTAQETASSAKASSSSTALVRYQVKKGDTLGAIAARNGVTVQDLMAWNNIQKATSLRAGQTIKIAATTTAATETVAAREEVEEKEATPPKAARAAHIVQQGDTLGAIAAHYQVSTNDLLRWNNLNKRSILKIGQKIVVESDGDLGRALAMQSGQSTIVEETTLPQNYKVQKGDTLGKIAQVHGASVEDLMRWNDIDKPSALRAGQVIRVSYSHETVKIAENKDD